MRCTIFFVLAALLAAAGPARGALQIKQHPDGRVELQENGKTALVYNSAPTLSNGAPEDRRRCCYIFPVYTPAGVAVLDDFPKDHWHHRGLFWAWPVVETSAGKLDLWMMKGIETRTVKPPAVVQKLNRVAIYAENGWYAGETKLVREQVYISLNPSQGDIREFDVDVRLGALGDDVTLRGSQEKGKSYGGFSARFAPRTDTIVRADGLDLRKDEDLVPHQWAELDAIYNGRRAVLRITPDRSNPEVPYQWCLRAYGFVGASFPGKSAQRDSYTLTHGRPLTLKFRVQLRDVR